MSVETLQTLTLISFIACGVFFAISVILFFILKIPEVIGDLTGTTARKAIEDIEEKNKSGNSHNLSYSRLMRGRLTEKIPASGNLTKSTGSFRQSINLGKSTRKLAKSSEETVLLSAVHKNETVPLAAGSFMETTILAQNPENETTLLAASEPLSFSVDVDLSLYESAETID